MKILVLGGAGAVCQHATRDLAETSTFEEIVIGDYNVEAAEALVAEIGDPRLRVERVNAEDEEALLAACRGYDVVLNGLPWRYDLAVTKACVEAGVSGLDVSTEESQWDYHEEAVEKGIVFIPGQGATPGITNAMARRGADLVDEVDEIQINFAAFRCAAPSMGLLITLLWEFDPTIESRLYYKDGEFHAVGPFEGARRVNFPGPIGEQEVYYIPHPETRTKPNSLGAKAVSVHGCFPPHVMRMVRSLLAAGFYSRESIVVEGEVSPEMIKGALLQSTFEKEELGIAGVRTTPHKLMHEVLIQLPESKQNPLWGYGLVVEVFGKRDGRQVKVKLWNRHPPQEEWGGEAAYYKNIALPLSVAAQMIARDDVTVRGVVPPETAIDPLIFFAELHKRGIEIHEVVETYRVVE